MIPIRVRTSSSREVGHVIREGREERKGSAMPIRALVAFVRYI